MLERTLEAFEGAYIYRGKIIDHPDDHQISDCRHGAACAKRPIRWR